MDPFTVIAMLAIHLLGTGGLMFLVWRLMPGAPGIGPWWNASCLFGLGYLVRLVMGLEHGDAVGVAGDSLMLLAVLRFGDGVREFTGRRAWTPSATFTTWAGVVAIEAAATAAFGAQGRYTALNLAIGLMYAQLAGTIVIEVPRQPAPLRAPLRLLAALMGGLAALTLLRAQSLFADGMEVAFHGPLAKAYYMYASTNAVVVGLTLLWLLFLRLNGQLADLAARDPLTGVLNRQGLDERVRRHFERARAAPLTVLLLDIDHFKRINDTHGHATGDAVLMAVAHTLVSHLRADDFVARVGGEEFLIGCAEGAHADDAMALARRLNEAVGRLQVAAPGDAVPVVCTVSVGVSGRVTSRADWDAGMRQADRALYQAKADGRNAVRPAVLSQAT
ncbi:MAG: GGDEF domain-containing protein [Rhizobacter sp.]